MDIENKNNEQLRQELKDAQQELDRLKEVLGLSTQTLDFPYKEIDVYRTVFDQSPLGISIVTPDNCLIYGNPRLCEMLGYSYNEIQKLKISDFTFTDDIELSKYWLRRLFQSEISSYQLEKRYLRKNGSIFWGMLTVAMVCDDDDKHLYSVGMIEDITQRKQVESVLRSNEQQFSNILNLAADGIISINASHEIILFNQGAKNIFDYEVEEVIGQPLDILLPLDSIHIHRQHINEFAEHPASSRYMAERGEIQGRRKSGDIFPAEASILKLEQDGETTFTVIIRDITERKQAEKKLHQLNDELDKRVQERTAKLAEANEHLHQEIERRIQAEAELRESEQRYRQMAEALQQAHDELEQRVQERTADLAKANAVLQTEIQERKQVEAALRQSQQLLQTTFDSLEESVFIIEASTRTILGGNKAIERMFGYTEAEIVGRNTEYLYVDREAYLEFGRRQAIALDSTGVLQMEFQVRRKDGTIIESEHTVTQMLDDSGKRVFLVGVVRDITQRKQAELALRQSEHSLKEAQAQAHLGHWKLIAETQEMEGSDELFRIFELNQDEIMIDSFISVVHPDDRNNAICHVQRGIEEGISWDMECRLLLKDGTLKHVHSKGAPVDTATGKPTALVGTVQDITERKLAETALLEQERLRVALTKQKEHNDLKDRFMSMISHEFRTPLAVIRTSSQLLERYTDKMSPEKRQTHLDRIAMQTLHLTEMLDNIVLIIEAEKNPIKFRPQHINLKDFCRNLVESLQNTIGLDHILLFTIEDELEEFIADSKLLRIIITNLLSNAIKYSPKSKNIYFDIFKQSGESVFCVRDEGIGITPEDQKRLFEPYFRSKSVENIKGIGLGLKIVRDFVELHQGRIEMKSIFGEGTEFTVYLPLDITADD